MGISFSTTTARRRAPTHPYPPPLHPDYYPPYPAHQPSPYPVHQQPSSPPVYYPYYNSNAYAVCNHAAPLVGQPYFGPFELQPPPRVVAPPCGDQKPTKVVNSDVNVHKDTLRLENDELNPDRSLVSFVFDALLDGSITIYYFAKEEADRRVVPLFPETYVPIKIPFRKGLHQEFRQPSGTGIDLRYFALDDLSNPSSRDDVFPIVISADTCITPYIVDDRSYLLAHTLPQMQITQVVLPKNHEGQFTPKVVRQLLWTDDTCYELREIYGLGKSGPGFSDSGSGKECVVCMTEPKDIALLPCRHMCMCSSCAKALRLQSNKCPICREIIEALLEIRIDNMDH
ncbi:probable E3 ubiquitin-protein ligase LUL4 isoform X2 [Salvia miltiorrhiza]|uniref:probable E3 ubiquitin-protein ligase LUL4 isoform X2 n=1 Tax=Salvia miltiorrhiza TaxID=226208 RepID=UPI0025AD2572|nr:probable E3 ubiquitin-protein ligase LUL4 isoform X2 [Salvia miltiorrhiza]